MIDPRRKGCATSATRVSSTIVLAAFVLLLLSAASLIFGASTYSIANLTSDPDARLIVFDLRLPRTVFAILVGGGLSIVGASYQAIFRNYLASPFTLGVSSGAALAASIAMVTGVSAGGLGIDVSVCAIAGALVSIALISAMGRRYRHGHTSTLLLAGIVFSFFCSSVLTLIQYVADYAQLFRVTRWLMGGIPSVGWSDVAFGAICVGVTVAWLLRNARGLDLMLFGDDLAIVKGIDADALTRRTFVLTSFVVGWVVAQCGVIGFVGIIVPALCRVVIGLRHRALLPLSFLVGACLVLACDIIGRVIIAPFEIPAGVFTAIIGGPVFIGLILTSRRMTL